MSATRAGHFFRKRRRNSSTLIFASFTALSLLASEPESFPQSGKCSSHADSCSSSSSSSSSSDSSTNSTSQGWVEEEEEEEEDEAEEELAGGGMATLGTRGAHGGRPGKAEQKMSSQGEA